MQDFSDLRAQGAEYGDKCIEDQRMSQKEVHGFTYTFG